MTLYSKVNRQDHVIYSNMCDILDIENVRIDTRIKLKTCLQPKRKIVINLDFQSYAMKIDFFHFHRLIP